ncbi:hypothetical protein HDV05_004033 [Chytridiales sp. JEL 0842]|nr:hypothetical protein HDV05_004033 [Chytridiales sp. JEL 0842]
MSPSIMSTRTLVSASRSCAHQSLLQRNASAISQRYPRPHKTSIKEISLRSSFHSSSSVSSAHDPSHAPNSSSPNGSHSKLTPEQRQMLETMLRVDHAGELGADAIYKGQMAVLGRDPKLGPLIQHMWDQEKYHKAAMDKLVGDNRVRPTALQPLWHVAGFVLGAGTALMGEKAAMACTEAVETVIGEHYNE